MAQDGTYVITLSESGRQALIRFLEALTDEHVKAVLPKEATPDFVWWAAQDLARQINLNPLKAAPSESDVDEICKLVEQSAALMNRAADCLSVLGDK